MAYYRITNNNFESVVNSNLKFIVTPDENNIMRSMFSIDVGQNGNIFHKNYDSLLYSHEKKYLISIDSDNTKKTEYTIFFINKK